MHGYCILQKVIEHNGCNEFLRTKDFHTGVSQDYYPTANGIKKRMKDELWVSNSKMHVICCKALKTAASQPPISTSNNRPTFEISGSGFSFQLYPTYDPMHFIQSGVATAIYSIYWWPYEYSRTNREVGKTGESTDILRCRMRNRPTQSNSSLLYLTFICGSLFLTFAGNII